MGRYVLKRILSAIPTLLGVFLVVFFVIRLIPGDPAMVMLGPNATEAQLEAYRERNGLNEDPLTQLWTAFTNTLRGDLGQSLSKYTPVNKLVAEHLPKTIELALWGLLFGTLFALILGVAAATNRGKWPDLLLTSFSTLGQSLPTFYIGIWVLALFAVKLKWIPVITSLKKDLPHWQTLFGPVLTMALGECALLTRTTRSAMLEVMGEDYIRTARAKGLSVWKVLYVHGLRNALIPIITAVGYTLATSLGGAIVLETVFVRNGIGKLLIDAINTRDYPLIQGTVLVVAVLMIAVNILTDCVYGLADPRIRVSGKEVEG